VVVLPSKDESKRNLLLFIERVWVDRWSGLVTAKRAVGHGKIAGRLRDSVSVLKVCE